MNSNDFSGQWSCSCDIEISFPSLEIEDFVAKLPDNSYVVEDKRELDWGVVIARDSTWQGDRRDISNLVVEFLSPIKKQILATKSICAATPIVRLGVYYGSFTFTLLLSEIAIGILRELSLELEISMYPTDEDDEDDV